MSIRHQRNPHRRAEAGFSMLELLLAAAVMMVGILGLAALQFVSLSQATGGRNRGTATFIAHNLLDQIQAEGAVTASQRVAFGKITLPADGFTYLGNADAKAQDKTAGPSYTNLGLLDDDPYYTANPTAPKDLLFSTLWYANEGSIIYKTGSATDSVSALQEFVVNVSWNEYNATTKTTEEKHVTVSRYVRL